MIWKFITILFVSCSYSLGNTDIFNDLASETKGSVLQSEALLSNWEEELGDTNETKPDCKCGSHSTGCNITDGFKTCFCEEGYVPGINENCTAMCNDTHKCQNGGTCFRGVCLCPPRTKGSFCEHAYAFCWNFMYEKIAGFHGQSCCCHENLTALCKYDVMKSDVYCECPNEGEVYDDSEKKCKDCNCGKAGTWSKCDFYGGVKTCFCGLNYEYNLKTETCEPCNCTGNSKKCEFSWSGEIDCNCWTGHQQYKTSCVKCDCGSDGSCELREGEPVCHCEKGFQAWKGSCKECDCGYFGKCIYDAFGKKIRCACDAGYSQKAGKCEFCYCGERAKCIFGESGNKSCECPHGFKDVLGFCRDIDECENPFGLCPANERCVNTAGGYVCGCADGYVKTLSGCTDINECENGRACDGANSECVNVPGSFECRCKSGYLSRGGKKTNLICQSDSASKVGYGLLGGFFSAVVIILLTILYRAIRSR